MRNREVYHVIGNPSEGDVGADEKDIGQRVLKIGGFHNDQGYNFKIIYSSRDVNDPNVLSFHEVHYFNGRKNPFHHKHLHKS
jgi:hypothetical protein